MMSSIRWNLICGLLVCWACATEACADTIIYNSLDPVPQPAVYIDPSVGYGPLADSFSTGGQVGSLSDVQIQLLFVNKINTVVSVDLTDNVASTTTPGSVLYHIGSVDASNYNNNSIDQYATIDFANLSQSLLANHRYWIELSTSLHGPAWTYTSNYGVGVANEFTYYGRLGQSYSNNAPGAVVFEMQVSTSAIDTPVPSTLVMSSILFGMLGAVWAYKQVKQPALAT
jgi:hypothetical protein